MNAILIFAIMHIEKLNFFSLILNKLECFEKNKTKNNNFNKVNNQPKEANNKNYIALSNELAD